MNQEMEIESSELPLSKLVESASAGFSKVYDQLALTFQPLLKIGEKS